MHPIRGGQEEAPVHRDRGRVADEVLQRRFLGAFRMDTLGHLGELVRVAKEHDRLRAAAHRDDVRQRHLTGLIDEQDVQAIFHLCASKQPGRAAGHVVAAAGQAALDLPVVRRHADAVVPAEVQVGGDNGGPCEDDGNRDEDVFPGHRCS